MTTIPSIAPYRTSNNKTTALLFLLLLFHILHVLVNQNGPSGTGLIIGTQIFALVAKIQKGRPLIHGNARVGHLRLDKFPKGLDSIGGNPVFQNQIHQGYDHFLVQRSMCAMEVETKAKLKEAPNNENERQTYR
jgi:hypothetical protein